VERLYPGALFIPEDWRGQAATEKESLEPLIYFSFTTLTTVGLKRAIMRAMAPLCVGTAKTVGCIGFGDRQHLQHAAGRLLRHLSLKPARAFSKISLICFAIMPRPIDCLVEAPKPPS